MRRSMKRGMKRGSFDVATICEPVAYLLAKLPRGISIQKFQRLLVVAPTCSSFEEMLEKLNLMREGIKEGSSDDLSALHYQ